MTFFELQKNEAFRFGVSQRIASMSNNPDFILPNSFPMLYRYRSMSDYAIQDILDNKLTLSLISTFNDLFDGAFHELGNVVDREHKAEEEWNKMKSLFKAAGYTIPLLDHDSFVEQKKEVYKRDSRRKFRELAYLGTYSVCFSSKNDSPLMWAHYANSNSGICIAYDFNQLSTDNMCRNALYPVVYTHQPFELEDLLNDKDKRINNHPLDTAILCASINKSNIWQYENEWRMVWVLPNWGEDQRLTIKFPIQPHAIYFGYHFLKQLCIYDLNSSTEKEQALHQRDMLLYLLEHMVKNHIQAYIMVPNIGTYSLSPIPLNIEKLQGLIQQKIQSPGLYIKYYYVIHDQLMDLIGQ